MGIVLTGLAMSGVASGGDIFGTNAAIPAGPAAPLLTGSDACRAAPLPSPLPLFAAIEQTLCESPKTRSAWAAVKAAAANVGQNKAAYLPTIAGTAEYSYDHQFTAAKDAPDLQTSFSQATSMESLSLVWLLYDFGGRSAALRNSKELLTAAQATENFTLQTAFTNAAKDYYSAQAAFALAQSARQIETATQQILKAAAARYKTGIAPITDQLQANTAYEQAVFARAAAEGAYRLTLGMLAVDMNLSPETPLTLPELDQGTLPDLGFVTTVHQLIDEAARTHPTVLAAKAQWEAALDDVDSARAQGLPRLQMVGDLSRSDAPLSASLGQPAQPAISRQGSIGVGVSIPLFEGFSRGYKIRQAQAVADQQAQAVRNTEEQVALGVWSSFQAVQTDTENLRNTAVILDSARQAFEAANQRYLHGVGGILELLAVENILAAAEQQRIQAQSDWRTARLLLAASLGKLGMWAIQ